MSLLSYDSSFFRKVSQIIDCIALSLLWVITSLPVITIGASTAALYHTVDKVIRREEGKLWKEYWRSFGREFKQATVLWLLALLIIGILVSNFFIAQKLIADGSQFGNVLGFLTVMLAVLMAIWMQYWFACLARFQNSIKGILRNTLGIMMAESKTDLKLVLLFAVTLATDVALSMYVPALTLLMPIAYITSLNRILEPLFSRYIEKQREQEENEQPAEG